MIDFLDISKHDALPASIIMPSPGKCWLSENGTQTQLPGVCLDWCVPHWAPAPGLAFWNWILSMQPLWSPRVFWPMISLEFVYELCTYRPWLYGP